MSTLISNRSCLARSNGDNYCAMIKPVLSLLVTLLIFPNIAAQVTDPCSQISVEAPEKVDHGAALVFNIKANDLSDVKYNWTVSAGTITSGQGTSVITADNTGLAGQSIEATIEVAGPNWKCSAKSKPVEIVGPLVACGMAFDDYGDIKWEDEKVRLDNFAIQLLNWPDGRGSIMIYAGNPTYRGEAQFRLQRAKNYLVKVRRIDSARLILTDAGFREHVETILHVVTKDLSPPVPDPTVALPLSQVRFTKKPPSQLKRKPSR